MHALRRAALATMAVAMSLALPIGIAVSAHSYGGGAVALAAPGTPVTTVSPSSGLEDGDTITVSGTGFSGAGAGIYVGLVQDDRFSPTDGSVWMTQTWIRPAEIVAGTWSTSVTVAATAGAFDCIENACSIYTVAAHGSTDRTQDTQVPVSFAAVTPTTTPAPTTTTTPTTTTPPTTTTKPPTTTTTAPTTTAPTTTTKPPTVTTTQPTTTTKPPVSGSGPRVSASKTSGLDAAGDTITVSGSGFATTGMGIYVGIAQTSRYSSSDASVFYGTQYIKAADMPGGSFSTQIDVVGAFPGGDCVANACALYTLAAHGSSDRSQDTMTPISFVGTAPPVTGGGTTTGGTTTGGGAAGAAPGTSFTANSGLSVSLSKSSEIDPSGETVTISGSGFSGAAPGLYVGLVQDNVFSSADASVWITSAFVKPEQIAGGTWSLPMELVATQGAYDCLKNSCSVYTVAAHGSSDRSQDTKTPVNFVGGVAPGTVTAPPVLGGAGAPGTETTAAVTLSKAKGLKIDGEEITISGTGFSGQQPGIYVGLIQEDKFSATDAGAWMTTAYITPSRISDGAWSTTMKVQAVKGDSDCTKNPCSIYTVAAHGSSDRSLDTRTPDSFGDDPHAPNADAAAAAPLTDDGGPHDDAAGATASDSAIRNLAAAIADGSAWIVPLLVGAVIGAGFAVGTTLALRRRTRPTTSH